MVGPAMCIGVESEGKKYEKLSDVALVELVVRANEPTLVDPDDDDEPLVAPNTTCRDVVRMLAEIQEYMQWSYDVDGSEIANFKRRVVARLKQSVISFEQVKRI